jgi:hypothetical protein
VVDKKYTLDGKKAVPKNEYLLYQSNANALFLLLSTIAIPKSHKNAVKLAIKKERFSIFPRLKRKINPKNSIVIDEYKVKIDVRINS